MVSIAREACFDYQWRKELFTFSLNPKQLCGPTTPFPIPREKPAEA
jgi:hypothetical protein